MSFQSIHKRRSSARDTRYSIRLSEKAFEKKIALKKHGWIITDYLRDAIEHAIDRAYEKKLGPEKQGESP